MRCVYVPVHVIHPMCMLYILCACYTSYVHVCASYVKPMLMSDTCPACSREMSWWRGASVLQFFACVTLKEKDPIRNVIPFEL